MHASSSAGIAIVPHLPSHCKLAAYSVSRRGQTGSALPATSTLSPIVLTQETGLKRTVDMWKSRTSTTGFPHVHSFGWVMFFFSNFPAIHRPVLAYFVAARGVLTPNTPHRLFRGRPVYSNSIFVDGVCAALFPQMDVWPSCCFGRATRSKKKPTAPHRASETPKCRGISAFPLTSTYHGCPEFPGKAGNLASPQNFWFPNFRRKVMLYGITPRNLLGTRVANYRRVE